VYAIIRPLLLRLGLPMLEDADDRAGSAAAITQLNGLPGPSVSPCCATW
jgi:hypothetical protein